MAVRAAAGRQTAVAGAQGLPVRAADIAHTATVVLVRIGTVRVDISSGEFAANLRSHFIRSRGLAAERSAPVVVGVVPWARVLRRGIFFLPTRAKSSAVLVAAVTIVVINFSDPFAAVIIAVAGIRRPPVVKGATGTHAACAGTKTQLQHHSGPRRDVIIVLARLRLLVAPDTAEIIGRLHLHHGSAKGVD